MLGSVRFNLIHQGYITLKFKDICNIEKDFCLIHKCKLMLKKEKSLTNVSQFLQKY